MWTDGREARRVGQRYGDRQRKKGNGGAQRGLCGGCCVGGVVMFGCCICTCSID